MKKIRSELESTVVEYIDDIVCNKCGNTCMGRALCNYEGLIEVTTTFGFGSYHFGDMTTLTFSLCEGCLHEDFKTWKYQNLNETDDVWGDEWIES